MDAHFHVFASLGEARQHNDCQLCHHSVPDLVCVDCDLEACAACTRLTTKGDCRGK